MLNLKKNYTVILLGIFLLTFSCIDKKSSIYNPDEVGIIMETTPGTILSSRKVVIAGLKKDTEYWGAAIGATIAGASTYGLTGGDNVLEEAAIIISVIGGAMAGTAIEEMRNKSDGIEYTISINSGESLVIVQAISNENDIIKDGTNINIIRSNNGYVRVATSK
ncbi:MAG: hypothetical protein CFH33_01634 [Alphaproteobacteria bacterium MarineAlpha9_Bin3]|nr:MAG: hypothetical protein CFH33_01634 [Alphaproteobacteria bacterium MarineAlpha9_Bin3]|tara:strand:- start:492 stop:983 length:492 start_codon:yes stop_codon:yes gene_type:complete